jgi:hypothetical protein
LGAELAGRESALTVFLLYLMFLSRDVGEHARQAWTARSVLLLNIAPETKPLPWSLTNASRPDRKLRKRWLPTHLYEDNDRERFRRLYGENTVTLYPTMVIMHFTVIDDAEAIIRSFSSPSRLPVGNQGRITSLVTVHYMVDQKGTVYQLVPEDRRTTGSYGVDHRALAIEMVAKNETDLMSRPLQMLSAFDLVDSLLRKYDIPVWRVFSHQEVASGSCFLTSTLIWLIRCIPTSTLRKTFVMIRGLLSWPGAVNFCYAVGGYGRNTQPLSAE